MKGVLAYTEEELVVTEYLYQIAEPGSVLFAGSEETPWKYKNVDKHKHHAIEHYIVDSDIEGLIELLKEHEEEGAYVLVMRSQIAHMEMFRNAPKNQWQLVKAELESSPEITFIHEGSETYIFALTSVYERNMVLHSGEEKPSMEVLDPVLPIENMTN